MNKPYLVGLGNVYVETNYYQLETNAQDMLLVGKEYQSPKYEIHLGGSCVNFALQAQKLGIRVGLIGKTGIDEMGKKLRSLLADNGIETSLLSSSSLVQTNIDTGIVLSHSGQNIQLVSGTANQSLSLGDIPLNSPLFSEVSALYLGGFFKQEHLYADYPNLTQTCKERGLQIFIDHGRIPVVNTSEKKQKFIESCPYIDGYFPNEEELLGITGKAELKIAAHEVLSWGVRFIAVKRGEKGCRVFSQQDDFSLDAHTVPIFTTVGAGDSFNAGFIAEYMNGSNLMTCAKIANAIAAGKVSTNTYPGKNDIDTIMSH